MRTNNVVLSAIALCFLPVAVVAQEQTILNNHDEVVLAQPVVPAPLPLLPKNGSAEYPQPPKSEKKLILKQTRQAPESQKPKRSVSLLRSEREVQEQKKPIGSVSAAPATVMPEVTTTVQLSSSDLNRIVCSAGDIKEALTSDEKGVMIKITGRDAFVKFKVAKMSDGKLSYSTTPTEIYLVCGGSTYSLVGFPSRLPSQTVKLSSGLENKIKENQALYAGLPFEKRVMRAIKETYTDNIPDSYLVTKMNQVDSSWKGMIVALRRTVDIEGEGLRVKEYHVSLKPKQSQFKLSEKMFLRKEFALNPIAVSIDKHVLKPGEVSRLFVVEQRAEAAESTMLSGFGLPGLVGDTSPTLSEPPQQGKKEAKLPNFNTKGADAPGGRSER